MILDPTTPKMKAFFTASLPLPPGINASYKRITIKNSEGEDINTLGATDALKQFKEDAALIMADYKTGGYRDWTLINAIRKNKFKTPLKIEITFYFPTLWKRDIDGGEKAVIDAVFARLELNDNLITDKHTSKWVDADRPRVDVEVYCDIRV